jgi:hypothetical protein
MPRAKAQRRKGRGDVLGDVWWSGMSLMPGPEAFGFLNSEKLCAFAPLREKTLSRE